MMRKLPSLFFYTLPLMLTACNGGTTVPPSTIDQISFEGAVGPYIQQSQLGSAEAKIGTGLVTKIRDPQGNPPKVPISIEVKGPAGWNGGTSYTFTYPAGGKWYVQPFANIPPVQGNYTVTGTVSGYSKSATFNLTDPKAKLTLANPSGTLTSTNLNLSWSLVPSALGYYARGMDATTGASVAETYTQNTNAILPVSNINTSHNFYTLVYATNFNSTLDNPTFSGQLLVSDSIGSLGFKAASLNKVSPNALRTQGFGR